MDVIDLSRQRIHSDRLQRDRRPDLYSVDEYGAIIAAAHENLDAAVHGQVANVAGVRFRALQD